MKNIATRITECDPPTDKRFKDLTGKQYGRLTVVEYYGKQEGFYKTGKRAGKPKRRHYWLCQCECGDTRAVVADSLHKGDTTSCGCYHRSRKTTHGLADHPSYKRYKHMVRRCTDPSCNEYPRYGGRGIEVWHTWLEKEDDKGLKRYLWYLDNVLGPCPGPEYTVDRIDNDGDYRPWNIRWSDKTVQTRNSSTRKITRDDALMIKFGDVPGTHKEIAKRFGVSPATVCDIRKGRSWAELTKADYNALIA